MASEQEKQVPEYINSFAGDRKSEATPLSTAGGLNRQSCYANSTPHEVTSTAFSIPKCKSQHWKRPVRTAGHKKGILNTHVNRDYAFLGKLFLFCHRGSV